MCVCACNGFVCFTFVKDHYCIPFLAHGLTAFNAFSRTTLGKGSPYFYDAVADGFKGYCLCFKVFLHYERGKVSCSCNGLLNLKDVKNK